MPVAGSGLNALDAVDTGYTSDGRVHLLAVGGGNMFTSGLTENTDELPLTQLSSVRSSTAVVDGRDEHLYPLA